MPQSNPESSLEKSVSYTTDQPYYSMGHRTPGTRTAWVVFHGIGQLARFFIRNFDHLDPDRNLVLAPQAPALYYTSDTYDRVGACWLTREKTERQMDNLLAYLDAMEANEKLVKAGKLVLFGYSQGVSVLCRWVARRQIPCQRIVLYAGKIPAELDPADFDHLPASCQVELYYGDSDPLADKWDRGKLAGHARKVFGNRLHVFEYAGGHELQRKWIRE